jgi:hypothetical protein
MKVIFICLIMILAGCGDIGAEKRQLESQDDPMVSAGVNPTQVSPDAQDAIDDTDTIDKHPDFRPCRLVQKAAAWYLIACPANIDVPVNGRNTRSWNTHMVYKEDIQ